MHLGRRLHRVSLPGVLLASLAALVIAPPAEAYVGDYESTFWRAWIMVGKGSPKSAAKSARVSYDGHMLKRYRIVNAHVDKYSEMAKSGTPEERVAAETEVGALKKRLEWMDVRGEGNQWIKQQYELPDHGALPHIQEDAALLVQLYHDAALRQVRAAEYEQRRERYDEADEFHREALFLWDQAAKKMARRLADLESDVGDREAAGPQKARLNFLRQWSAWCDRTAKGLRSEYEADLDPRRIVNKGLFYKQRVWLYADDGDGEFVSAYKKKAEFLFGKAHWRCEQLIENGEADPGIRRLARQLDGDDPDPPGQPIPAEFYDAVAEEYKMFTYFKEFWRDGATSINID